MSKQACGVWLEGKPCRRRATHDLQYTRIREMDEEGKPSFHGKTGEPVFLLGQMAIIEGGAVCRVHATKWAARLNEKQERKR